jgi:O-antigen ligase/Flp pilus assembly protein TadD
MNTQKLQKYIKYALIGSLYAILLTPILVSSKYLFPFITTKTMYFRLFVELAIFLYFWLAVINKNYRPKMTKLSWCVVIFSGIIFLTAITGVNFYKSFWGTIERGEGFLTISHLIAYFLILSWTFKSKKEWINYFTGIVIVGLCVEFYALFQKLKVQKFLFWQIINSGEGRLSATIGNAAFLGAYSLQMFYLSLFLFFARKHLVWKIFLAFSCVLSLFILYHTQTRGAIVGLVATLPLLILSFIFVDKSSKEENKEKQKKVKIVALAFLLLIFGFIATVYFNRNSKLVQNQSTLQRIVSISKTDITTQSRFMAWDSSWNGWKDKFLLGYGWENYNIAFNKYFHPEIFVDQGSQLWFDRAHNTIFDIAVATGIFGLLAYLAIFFIACKTFWNSSKKEFFPARILFFALLAHFLQNIFVFDVLASYIGLFNIFAFASFLYLENKNNNIAPEKQDNNIKDSNYILAIIAFLILFFAAYIFNIKPLKANLLAVDGLIASSQNKEQSAINFFKQGIDIGTYQTPELRQKLADNTLLQNTNNNGLTNEQVAKNFDLTISELKKNIENAKLDVQNYLYLMAILNRSASFDANRYNEVISLGEKAILLSGARPQIYFEMGQARVAQKKYAEAIEYFKKGVDLNPKTMESRWNLMAAYIVAGQDDNAKEQYNFMEANGYNFDRNENLQRFYRIYAVAGKKQEMTQVLERIAELYPSGENYARLAAAYAEIGEKEKAKLAVAKAVELDPSLKAEADRFLEILK